jgi:hypothetical protein
MTLGKPRENNGFVSLDVTEALEHKRNRSADLNVRPSRRNCAVGGMSFSLFSRRQFSSTSRR